MITMSARTADSALRARRPRAVGHCSFTIENSKSVDTFYTSSKTLHLIAVARLRLDSKTQLYMERRRAEGLSKRDVLRCLKRFIAREVFNALKLDLLKTDT